MKCRYIKQHRRNIVKSVIIAALVLLFASYSYADPIGKKVRIVYMPDGGIAIIHPVPNSRRYRNVNMIEALKLAAIADSPIIIQDEKGDPLNYSRLNLIKDTYKGWLFIYLETAQQWTDRVFSEAMKGNLKGLPYEDINKTELPKNRVDRNYWIKERGKAIKIDMVKKQKGIQKKAEKAAREDRLRAKMGISKQDWADLKDVMSGFDRQKQLGREMIR